MSCHPRVWNRWLNRQYCLAIVPQAAPIKVIIIVPLHEHHGVSNYQELNCLFNSLFMVTSKKALKFRVTDRLWRESTADQWILFFIPTPTPTLQRSWKWGILISPCPSVRPSFCPPVSLWTESCPLCIFNNTNRIHFIFVHLIKQLQKACRV